jgi:hypothetical protein
MNIRKLFILIVIKLVLLLKLLNLKFDLKILRKFKKKLCEIYDYCETDTEIEEDPTMTYNFRPFELCKVKYTKKAMIDPANPTTSSTIYPKARSGHRTVCTNTSLYCFGGFNPTRSGRNADEEENLNCLFSELWRFDLISKKWSLVLGSKNEFYENTIPRELASNAMTMLGNTLMVSRFFFIFSFVEGHYRK